MNTLLVLIPGDAAQLDRLREIAKGRLAVEVLPEDAPEADIAAALRKAEVVFGEPAPALLEKAKVLRWIQMSWAGADLYTHAPHFPETVQLTNATGVYGVTIAEHAMAMLLALCRRLPAYGRQQREKVWQDCGSEWALEGKHALILGAGDIGTNLAIRLRSFGVTCTGVRRVVREKPDCFAELGTLAELDQLLPQADLVACSLPDAPHTRGLLDRKRLLSMKRDAILLNVGRGSLIDTDALADVMAAGHLFGAGLDVVQPEPLPRSHRLWELENVILTPHVAGVGFGHAPQTAARIWTLCTENLQRYLAGEPLRNVVDFSSGYRTLPERE